MSDQPQIVLGKDKAFTYDFVFDTFTEQAGLYQTCVENLVSGCFSGYNATVLAYGQTGSGKTYTMGTGFDMAVLPEEQGVIPRAVSQIFNGMEERRSAAMERDEPQPQFELTAQFLELYNEEIIDLFDANRDSVSHGCTCNKPVAPNPASHCYPHIITTLKFYRSNPPNEIEATLEV